MKFLSSLDSKDRRMLLTVFGLVVALLIVFAVFTPPEDPNSNPVPDSYLAGRHGAKAAFTVLQQSGYEVQPVELALWAIPTAVIAWLVHGARIMLLGQKLKRARALPQ